MFEPLMYALPKIPVKMEDNLDMNKLIKDCEELIAPPPNMIVETFLYYTGQAMLPSLKYGLQERNGR